MLWIDVAYAKLGACWDIFYAGIGKIGTEAVNIATEIGKIFGA